MRFFVYYYKITSWNMALKAMLSWCQTFLLMNWNIPNVSVALLLSLELQLKSSSTFKNLTNLSKLNCVLAIFQAYVKRTNPELLHRLCQPSDWSIFEIAATHNSWKWLFQSFKVDTGDFFSHFHGLLPNVWNFLKNLPKILICETSEESFIKIFLKRLLLTVKFVIRSK